MDIDISFENDTEVDGLREEQAYWNANDGELFFLIEDRGEEVTILSQDGSVTFWEKEGSIFQDECVGTEIIPVKANGLEVQ